MWGGLVGSGHVRLLYVETSNSGRFQKSMVSVIVVLSLYYGVGDCGEVAWRHCTLYEYLYRYDRGLGNLTGSQSFPP